MDQYQYYCDKGEIPICSQVYHSIKRKSVHLIIFLLLLFLLIIISRPALIMNDETITVNQLHQIASGKQILINECKYGCFSNGTPSQYYINRNNILGYTLILPLVSLPLFTTFSFFGDFFRLPVIICWSSIPILIAFLIHGFWPEHSSFKRIPMIYPSLIISTGLLIINLYYYHPFIFFAENTPVESGALIMTNTIIGAFLGVIIYEISRQVFRDTLSALFSFVAIISGSSYLFWAGTGKDHILSTLVFAIVTLCLIHSIISNRPSYRYTGFFFIGILAWIRPEMGGVLFFSVIFYQITEWLVFNDNRTSLVTDLLKGTLFTGLGIVPLFINNHITTNNPLTPPFFYYLSHTVPSGAPVWYSQSEPLISIITPVSDPIPGGISTVLTLIPDLTQMDLFHSLSSVFLIPPPGNLSIFLVSPIFLVGGIILLIIGLTDRSKIFSMERNDKRVLLLLFILLLAVFLPYIHIVGSYSEGGRPGPDMRYFLPVYLIGGLIGLFPLMFWFRERISDIWKRPIYLISIPILIILTTLILIYEPFGGPGDGYRIVYIPLVYSLSLLSILFLLWGKNGNRYNSLFCSIFLTLMFLPLVWQFVFCYYFSIGRFNGYPFWLPYLEYLYEVYIPYPWK